MNKDVLIGGAIGDAFGSHYENGPFPMAYVEHDNWHLTDDTVLTLATARSLINAVGFDIDDMAKEYVREFQSGNIVGIGASTLKAMIELEAGCSPLDSGRKGERAAGNGAAMRCAPLCAFFDPTRYEHRRVIRTFTAMTHANDEAFSATLAIMGALLGDNPIEAAITAACDSNTRDVLLQLRETKEQIGQVARRIGTSGYAAESVPLAIYAASQAPNIGFKRVIIEVCCCGGDADTIASMAGQIMASNGYGADEDWLGKLPRRDEILEIGERLERL